MTKEITNKKLMMEMLRNITTSMDEMKADMNKRFDEMNQRLDKIEQRLDRVEQNINFSAEEIGKLKMVIQSQAMHEESEPTKQKLEVKGQMSDEILYVKNAVQEISNLEHLEELWNNVLSQVAREVSKPSFETWIKSTKLLAYDNNSSTVAITAPNSFARDWLENHYSHLITGILTKLTGENLLIKFVVQEKQTSDDFELPEPII